MQNGSRFKIILKSFEKHFYRFILY